MTQFTAEDVLVLENIMTRRRDVRGNRFLPTPIADGDLEQILNAGVHAPSVGYSQPWRFVVIRSDQTKSRIRQVFEEENAGVWKQFDADRQETYQQLKLEGIEEAPVNLAVFYKRAGEPVLGQTSMPEAGLYSVVCAIQNMWLMARALNIGLGWVSIVDPLKVREILKAPADHELVGYLCLGYVDHFLDQPELQQRGWDSRKTLDDVVIRESY